MQCAAGAGLEVSSLDVGFSLVTVCASSKVAQAQHVLYRGRSEKPSPTASGGLGLLIFPRCTPPFALVCSFEEQFGKGSKPLLDQPAFMISFWLGQTAADVGVGSDL